MTQIKIRKEKKTRKSKAKACQFSLVSSSIITSITKLESTKDVWDYIKLEYLHNQGTKSMQVLNLIKEFEIQRMKKIENIKDYKLLIIVKKARMLH